MTLLSLVVPVFGVAGYLRECLDSILGQSFRDLEVIVVDDCSTDHSGAIADEYARRDGRVRVLHLERNVGLGPARDAGLAVATGEYVWFVDGDDWLAEGACRTVANRLAATRPDVLVVDFVRIWMTGETRRSGLRGFLPPDRTPDVFDAHERPAVLKAMHTAWGRVIRRDFLREIDLGFQPGWYEDVSFTLPLLAAARRISVTYRVCYYYRQRRQGAITGTRSNRHMAIFDQYEEMYAWARRRGLELGELESVIFERMLMHYRWVVGASVRLPRHGRREFFVRLAEHYRHYRPAGHRDPGGLEGVKRRLIARGSYRTFAAAQAVQTAIVAAGKRIRQSRAAVVAAQDVIRLRTRVKMLYYRLQCRLPIDPKLAVYSAYWGRGYRCNPAAIFEKAAELAPDVHGVWLVKRPWRAEVPSGVDSAVVGSLRYYRLMARAKYLVNNVNFPSYLTKRPGSIHLQTQHGTPLKVMGMDHYRFPIGARGMDLEEFLRRADRWDFCVSSGAFETEVWLRSFPCGYEMLETGYPRNDQLDTATSDVVASARAALGLAADETVVLFAPTHRDYQVGYQPLLDLDEFADALGEGYRVLARLHHFYGDGSIPAEERHARVLDVSAYPRIEDLYLASDVLITDYSSAMFDYAHLDRPIVVFAPDWEAYRRTRGVTFDLLESPPGLVALTYQDLVDAFRTGAVFGDASDKLRADFRNRFVRIRDGRASERVVRRVFLGEPVTALTAAPPGGAGLPRQRAAAPEQSTVAVREPDRAS